MSFDIEAFFRFFVYLIFFFLLGVLLDVLFGDALDLLVSMVSSK